LITKTNTALTACVKVKIGIIELGFGKLIEKRVVLISELKRPVSGRFFMCRIVGALIPFFTALDKSIRYK